MAHPKKGVALRHIRDLRPDPQNRRKHTPRNIGMIVDALHQVGAARSIVIDERGEVLAGNGVLEAAGEAGITKLRVIDVDGETMVAVRRTGLTRKQKRALAIYDNRAAELAEWDTDQLRQDFEAGDDLSAFFRDEELSQLLGLPGGTSGETDPDDAPAPRPTTITPGMLFELGNHRLLCGDSTAVENVARVIGEAQPGLMVTDPPYGVQYDPAWRRARGVNKSTAKLGPVQHDDRADWRQAWERFPGDVAYIWHAGSFTSLVQDSLEGCGFVVRAQIIWAKNQLALSRGDYHWQHEPCWYAVRKNGKGRRTADRTQTTVWTIPVRDDAGHGHGTQKPVECMARPMRNHQFRSVYDPFVGSGTTLIAAEQLGHSCYAIEIDPSYCQVAIDRWEGFSGEKAVRGG